ncbi:MAG: PhzF family phenazine biosynthesis protein [Armatimonadetes bacterium]|nr:PhzF family phenazine biosynthesis protein [Armatimonadota bacterium]
MPQRIFLVDAFAHAPFTGNPAGVCPLDAPAEEQWMQGVALEMNQAETAFFWPEGDRWGLRWFTPVVEVDLCGHATLASAHIMYETGLLPSSDPARFMTKSGELVCTKTDGGIAMDFPSEMPEGVDPFPVSKAIGVEPTWFGANRMDWFFVLESEKQVRSLAPNFREIADLGERGVIVTAQANTSPETGDKTPADFVSRFFAPQSGIDEDPVTGSAHCALGPFWSARLGKKTVVGYQASRRGGFVTVENRNDRVNLIGKAQTVFVGELKL